MYRVSVLPAICYAVLLVFACLAALQIGHWPYYAHPDPKELLSLRAVYLIASYATLLGVVSVVVLPACYAIFRTLAQWRKWRKWRFEKKPKGIILYSVGATLWILDFVLMFTHSRWSLMSWIFD